MRYRGPHPYDGWLACAARPDGKIIFLARTYEEQFRQNDLKKTSKNDDQAADQRLGHDPDMKK